MTKKIEDLLSTLDTTFNDPAILKLALTHRSFLNENRDQKLVSNERLEFLGDAVLELWVSNYLYQNFPDFAEGKLTNLRALTVCTQNLAIISQNLDIGHHILLSKGEETHGGRDNLSILADTLESIIGAIYLDQGYTQVDKFLATHLIPSITAISKQQIYKDPKSNFQEIAQAKTGFTPYYQTVSETGPDHQKTFEVAVYVGDNLIATGTGSSKQKAEEDASIKATKIYNNPV